MKFESSSAMSKGLGNALETISEVGSLPLIRGQWYFVDPTSGADTSDGRTIDTAVKGLKAAYDKVLDGDGIALLSYGATAAATTSYLTQDLVWAKNGITVVGIAAPVRMFGRARVANKTIVSTVALTAVANTSLTRASGSFIADGWEVGMQFITNVNAVALTVATVSATVITITSGTLTVGAHTSVTSVMVNLMTVSGMNNRFYNVHFWNGGSNALEMGGVKVTGARNYFSNCHIVGSAAVAHASARSLEINAGEENFFDSCTIGSDSIDRGNNAMTEIILAGAAARNRFKECEILMYVAAGTAAGAIRSNGTNGGRSTVFDRCVFNAAFSVTTPADVHLVTGTVSKIVMKGCSAYNFTGWGASAFVDGPAAAASAGGCLGTTE